MFFSFGYLVKFKWDEENVKTFVILLNKKKNKVKKCMVYFHIIELFTLLFNILKVNFNPIWPGLLRAPQTWGGIKLSHPCIFSSSNSIDLKFGMNIIYNEKVSKNFFCDYDVIIYDDVSILIISSPGFWESAL